MRDFIILFVHVIVTVLRFAAPGGVRSVVAESALIRHQLLILNRGRKRAPNLRVTDRLTAGLFTLFMSPARILRSAIACGQRIKRLGSRTLSKPPSRSRQRTVLLLGLSGTSGEGKRRRLPLPWWFRSK